MSRHQGKLANYRTPPILRQWYVAGFSEDFGDDLDEVVINNQSMVRYRTSVGEPILLSNRCPHRSFPLSESWREGDDIRCRYHGAKFNSDGEFVEVPSQDMCPKGGVKKFPVQEVGPFVWVWLAPTEPNKSLLPELPFDSENWSIAKGRFLVEGNMMFMVENLADLTHIPFTHKDTLGFPTEFAKSKIDIALNGRELSYKRDINNPFYHKTPFFAPETGEKIGRHKYIAQTLAYYMASAWNYARISLVLDQETAKNDPEVQEEYYSIISHFLTPETDKSCHYYWLSARNYDLGNQAVTDLTVDNLTTAFLEDLDVVALLQRMVDTDQSHHRETVFGGDKFAIMMRQLVQTLVNEEAELFGT